MLPRNRLLEVSALAWAVAFASFHHPAAWAEVVVLAGSAAGRVGKEPDAAKVNEPFAVAFDAEGRMYGVEYTRGNRLFRVAQPAAAAKAEGGVPQVEFVAGTFYVPAPKQSFPPDAATAAGEVRFHGLHDVAIGPDDAVYVADTFNHRIRAFEPKSGTVRVVAGTGVSGFAGDGGPATAAQFNQASCGTLLPDGAAMLVADIGNARLRRIDLVAGTVETIVGNGQQGKPVDGVKALETPLAGPRAACQAKDGTIYLALREGNALVEIKQGVVRTVVNAAGKGGYGGDGAWAAPNRGRWLCPREAHRRMRCPQRTKAMDGFVRVYSVVHAAGFVAALRREPCQQQRVADEHRGRHEGRQLECLPAAEEARSLHQRLVAGRLGTGG